MRKAPELFEEEEEEEETDNKPQATRSKETDIYALGMVGPRMIFSCHLKLIRCFLDDACKSVSQISMVFMTNKQEIFTNTVPYAEFRTDAGVFGAIQKRQIPGHPSELSGPEKLVR